MTTPNIEEMIAAAVAKALGQVPEPEPVPAVTLTLADVLHNLVRHANFATEGEQREAHAAIDTHFAAQTPPAEETDSHV